MSALRAIGFMRANRTSLVPVVNPCLDSGYSQQGAGPAALAPQVEVVRVDYLKIFLMAQKRGSNWVAGVRAFE